MHGRILKTLVPACQHGGDPDGLIDYEPLSMLGSYLYIYEFAKAVSSWLSVNFHELPPGSCCMQCAGDFKMIIEVESAGNQGTKRLF